MRTNKKPQTPVKIEMICATVRGFSVQWQLLFLCSFLSPPTVDLPSTKNIHHVCRSVSDYSISQLFPFALCHFYSYPTLLKHSFSKFSWLPVICLTSITLRYLYPYSISSDRVGENSVGITRFHQFRFYSTFSRLLPAVNSAVSWQISPHFMKSAVLGWCLPNTRGLIPVSVWDIGNLFHSSRTGLILFPSPKVGLVQSCYRDVRVWRYLSPGPHFYTAGVTIAAQWFTKASTGLLQVPLHGCATQQSHFAIKSSLW